MIIDGKVYRDDEHPEWCLCPACVAVDPHKIAFMDAYENTFGPNGENDTLVVKDADI